jgi:hypothetical protein
MDRLQNAQIGLAPANKILRSAKKSQPICRLKIIVKYQYIRVALEWSGRSSRAAANLAAIGSASGHLNYPDPRAF